MEDTQHYEIIDGKLCIVTDLGVASYEEARRNREHLHDSDLWWAKMEEALAEAPPVAENGEDPLPSEREAAHVRAITHATAAFEHILLPKGETHVKEN